MARDWRLLGEGAKTLALRSDVPISIQASEAAGSYMAVERSNGEIFGFGSLGKITAVMDGEKDFAR
jgi:hypothetical protein